MNVHTRQIICVLFWEFDIITIMRTEHEYSNPDSSLTDQTVIMYTDKSCKEQLKTNASHSFFVTPDFDRNDINRPTAEKANFES